MKILASQHGLAQKNHPRIVYSLFLTQMTFRSFVLQIVPLSVFSDRHFLGRGEALQCLTLRGNKYSTFRSSGSNAVFINFVKLYPVATLFDDNAFILRKWWYLSSDIYPPPERDVLLYPGAETRDLSL